MTSLSTAHTRLHTNPHTETFGDIIVDYSYVECTSACVTALLAFSRQHPQHRAGDIKRALGRAEAFIRRIQRPDGSWWVALAAPFFVNYGIQCCLRHASHSHIGHTC